MLRRPRPSARGSKVLQASSALFAGGFNRTVLQQDRKKGQAVWNNLSQCTFISGSVVMRQRRRSRLAFDLVFNTPEWALGMRRLKRYLPVFMIALMVQIIAPIGASWAFAA